MQCMARKRVLLNPVRMLLLLLVLRVYVAAIANCMQYTHDMQNRTRQHKI